MSQIFTGSKEDVGAKDFVSDSGTATEVNNALNIFGEGMVSTSALGDTITVAANRLFIEEAGASYNLSAEEIKGDPIIFFTSTTTRTVTVNFPGTFEEGHNIDCYQGFPQGLGDIVIAGTFFSPFLANYRKPDFISVATLPSSKIKLKTVERVISAFAILDPASFSDGTAAEVTYRSRYRLRAYNTGSISLEIGIDDVPIEAGWTGVSRYTLEASEEKYIPKGADGFVLQTIGWSSTGGSAPEGGQIIYDWTKVSDSTKTVDITDNTNSSVTFTLYKRPLLSLI